LVLRHGFSAGQDRGPLLETAAPPIAPAAEAAATTDEPNDEQQHNCADRGVDNRADNADTKMNADLRQQPVTDEGADNSDYQVTNDPETGTLDDLSGEPAGDETNQQYDNETFI
jgi:hypothetical protein